MSAGIGRFVNERTYWLWEPGCQGDPDVPFSGACLLGIQSLRGSRYAMFLTAFHSLEVPGSDGPNVEAGWRERTMFIRKLDQKSVKLHPRFVCPAGNQDDLALVMASLSHVDENDIPRVNPIRIGAPSGDAPLYGLMKLSEQLRPYRLEYDQEDLPAWEDDGGGEVFHCRFKKPELFSKYTEIFRKGDSGLPIFDAQKRLVGIHLGESRIDQDAREIGFASVQNLQQILPIIDCVAGSEMSVRPEENGSAGGKQPDGDGNGGALSSAIVVDTIISQYPAFKGTAEPVGGKPLIDTITEKPLSLAAIGTLASKKQVISALGRLTELREIVAAELDSLNEAQACCDSTEIPPNQLLEAISSRLEGGRTSLTLKQIENARDLGFGDPGVIRKRKRIYKVAGKCGRMTGASADQVKECIVDQRQKLRDFQKKIARKFDYYEEANDVLAEVFSEESLTMESLANDEEVAARLQSVIGCLPHVVNPRKYPFAKLT